MNGCPNITVEGIDAVARSCVQLESVSLARCGDAVVDDMLVSLGRHCHYVRTLLVCDAPQLQDRGISAVVHGCRRLRRLDLTGCTGLKDVAVLPFAEAMFKPGLQHLFLCGCRGVSDTGLQWIADGLASKGLITLSLKGSGITSVALKSVLDAFKYSEYRKNDAYFGVWPTRRWQQRIVINECVKEDAGAATATTTAAGLRYCRARHVCAPAGVLLLLLHYCCRYYCYYYELTNLPRLSS